MPLPRTPKKEKKREKRFDERNERQRRLCRLLSSERSSLNRSRRVVFSLILRSPLRRIALSPSQGLERTPCMTQPRKETSERRSRVQERGAHQEAVGRKNPTETPLSTLTNDGPVFCRSNPSSLEGLGGIQLSFASASARLRRRRMPERASAGPKRVPGAQESGGIQRRNSERALAFSLSLSLFPLNERQPSMLMLESSPQLACAAAPSMQRKKIPLTFVRVVLERALPVRLLDLGVGRALLDAQDLVVLGVVRAGRPAAAAAHVKAPAASERAAGAEEAPAKHCCGLDYFLARGKAKERKGESEREKAREGNRRKIFLSLRSK